MSFGAIREKLRAKGAQAAMLLAVLVIAGGALWPQQTQIAAQTASHASELEARLGEVLSEISGAGRVEVAIQYEVRQEAQSVWSNTQTNSGNGAPASVIVVAQGAGDVAVRLRLARAVQTLLQLDAECVEVFEMRKGE